MGLRDRKKENYAYKSCRKLGRKQEIDFVGFPFVELYTNFAELREAFGTFGTFSLDFRLETRF